MEQGVEERAGARGRCTAGGHATPATLFLRRRHKSGRRLGCNMRNTHTHTHWRGERELVSVLATLPPSLSLSCSPLCVDVIPGTGVEAGVVEATRHASLVCHRLRPATIIHSTDSLGEAGEAVVTAAAATLDSGHR